MSTSPSGATFNEAAYRSYVEGMEEEFTIMACLWACTGSSLCCSLSIYALIAQCSRKTQHITIILSLTIFALFFSMSIYAVIWLFSTQSGFLMSLVTSGVVLWDHSNIHMGIDSLQRVKDYTQLQYCAGTAVLMVNITLGDAIVCWRACVVWHGNRAVRMVCVVFLLAIFALGVVGTNLSCNSRITSIQESGNAVQLMMVGFMFEGFLGGIAACVLSLTTNLVATLLVGFKAWESRQRLLEYLVGGPRTVQVKKLFALLIESGTLYSALWVVIVGFQVGQYRFMQTADPNYVEGFFAIVGAFISKTPPLPGHPTQDR